MVCCAALVGGGAVEVQRDHRAVAKADSGGHAASAKAAGAAGALVAAPSVGRLGLDPIATRGSHRAAAPGDPARRHAADQHVTRLAPGIGGSASTSAGTLSATPGRPIADPEQEAARRAGGVLAPGEDAPPDPAATAPQTSPAPPGPATAANPSAPATTPAGTAPSGTPGSVPAAGSGGAPNITASVSPPAASGTPAARVP